MSRTTKSAAVLVPIVRAQETMLLFEVRAASIYQPGEICFPGGGMEAGESAEGTALRETYEELGIRAEDIHLLGQLEPLIHISRRMVYPVIGSLLPEVVDRLSASADEVAETFLVPLRFFRETPPELLSYDLIADMDTVPEVLRLFVEHYRDRRTTPVWVWEGHVIWGLTARIIQQLPGRFPV